MIALTLISERGPKFLRSPYPRSERKSLGGCRTFGADLRKRSSKEQSRNSCGQARWVGSFGVRAAFVIRRLENCSLRTDAVSEHVYAWISTQPARSIPGEAYLKLERVKTVLTGNEMPERERRQRQNLGNDCVHDGVNH